MIFCSFKFLLLYPSTPETCAIRPSNVDFLLISLEYVLLLTTRLQEFNAATMITKGVSNVLAIQAFMSETTPQFLPFHIISNPQEKLSQFYGIVHRFTEGD